MRIRKHGNVTVVPGHVTVSGSDFERTRHDPFSMTQKETQLRAALCAIEWAVSELRKQAKSTRRMLECIK